MDFETRQYRVNGIAMNVAVAGEGPPVLLVHGFPDDHTVWRHQAAALLAAGYRVIAPDTRGCGDTEMLPSVADYGIGHLVADLVALLDLLGVATVRLVGHDWGAMICWHLCLRHPDRVERYLALSVGHPNCYANGGLEQKIKGYYVLLIQLRGFAEWLFRVGDWKAMRLMTRFPDGFPAMRRQYARPGRLTAGFNYYRANLGLVFKSDWPVAAMPVMGVWSSGDIFLSEAQMRRSGEFVAHHYRYERVEGANHWLQLTASDKVNALLLDFMGEQRATSTGPRASL